MIYTKDCGLCNVSGSPFALILQSFGNISYYMPLIPIVSIPSDGSIDQTFYGCVTLNDGFSNCNSICSLSVHYCYSCEGSSDINPVESTCDCVLLKTSDDDRIDNRKYIFNNIATCGLDDDATVTVTNIKTTPQTLTCPDLRVPWIVPLEQNN